MSVAHKAKATALSCIDFRFQQMIKEDLEKRGLEGNVDIISIPGASKNQNAVMEYAKASLKLHDPDEVFIYEHKTCGMYEQDDSDETHKANAQALAAKLKELKPSLIVTTLIATPEGIKEL